MHRNSACLLRANSGHWEQALFAKFPNSWPNLTRNLRFVQRDQKYKLSGGADRKRSMWILTIYVLIVLVMELIVVGVGLALDRIYPSLSLTISLSLFFAVLWLAWVLAVRVTQPKDTKSKEHAI